ncbi:hypothetical protein BC830DRAFT_1141005 [Chytriomyces sp. MP71]|nr:hypothetical protein BC830DRAFT_1141005 [Chytriomyces sp. MP71]
MHDADIRVSHAKYEKNRRQIVTEEYCTLQEAQCETTRVFFWQNRSLQARLDKLTPEDDEETEECRINLIQRTSGFIKKSVASKRDFIEVFGHLNFGTPMSPLELEMYLHIKNVIGVDQFVRVLSHG